MAEITFSLEVLRALERAAAPMRLKELYAVCTSANSTSAIASALWPHLEADRVTREGEPGQYAYSLTDKGRAFISDPSRIARAASDEDLCTGEPRVRSARPRASAQSPAVAAAEVAAETAPRPGRSLADIAAGSKVTAETAVAAPPANAGPDRQCVDVTLPAPELTAAENAMIAAAIILNWPHARVPLPDRFKPSLRAGLAQLLGSA